MHRYGIAAAGALGIGFAVRENERNVSLRIQRLERLRKFEESNGHRVSAQV